jgi:ATP-dependent DNA ligase
MEQENNKYRSTSGQIDGQKTISQWTISEPKNFGKANATSAVEQCTLEIEAKYKKQLKSGGYYEHQSDIDKEQFFQVMLAKNFVDYKDKLDWKSGVGVQIKYNGGRMIATKTGLWTRKGEKYVSAPHIEEALKPFFLKYPDAILDGEGYNYPLREKLNEIMKLLRKTVYITPADFQRSKELIRFYIYDGYGFPAGKNLPNTTSDSDYLLRKQAIDNSFFAPVFADRYKDIVHHVPTWVVHSESELETLYKKFLDDKQEGAILRILNVPYDNKRSKYLLKYKPIDTAEFEIIGIEEGIGNRSGMAGAVWFQYSDGRKFKGSLKGNEAQFKEILQRKKEFIGHTVTVHYNGLTGKGKGLPNYARLDCNNYDQTGDCPKLEN